MHVNDALHSETTYIYLIKSQPAWIENRTKNHNIYFILINIQP